MPHLVRFRNPPAHLGNLGYDTSTSRTRNTESPRGLRPGSPKLDGPPTATYGRAMGKEVWWKSWTRSTRTYMLDLSCALICRQRDGHPSLEDVVLPHAFQDHILGELILPLLPGNAFAPSSPKPPAPRHAGQTSDSLFQHNLLGLG